MRTRHKSQVQNCSPLYLFQISEPWIGRSRSLPISKRCYLHAQDWTVWVAFSSLFFFSLFELLLKSELMMQIQGFLCSKFTGKLTPLFNSPQFVAMYFITREIQHTYIYPKIQMKFIYIYIYIYAFVLI
jgi:hypothetical protein